jgi:cobalt ECF transporter T component CbiQ
MNRGWTRRATTRLAHAAGQILQAETTARQAGALQALDPRAKLCALLAVAIAVSVTTHPAFSAAICAGISVAAAASGVPWRQIAGHGWLAAGSIVLFLALPLLVTTPGEPWFALGPLTVTQAGLHRALLVLFRTLAMLTASTVLVLTTPWNQLLAAMQRCGAPRVAVAIIALTARYVLLFLRTAQELLEARESRRVGRVPSAEQRRLTAQAAVTLLAKTASLSDDVYLAMRARGFRGDIRCLTLTRLGPFDWMLMAVAPLLPLAAWWWR